MEGHIAVANDKLVEGLKFAVPDVASYVNSRESVTYWPSGGNSYAVRGVKVIKIQLNGDNWLDSRSVKLFFNVKNDGALPLAPRHPGPWVFFRRARLIMGGQVIQDTDFFNRTTHMFHTLKSAERRLNDFAMGFGCSNETNATFANAVMDTSTQIAVGESIAVGFHPFLLGLFNQASFIPLRYAPIQLEFELVGTATDAVFGNTTNPATLTDLFSIENVQLKCDTVTIDNTVDNRFTEILMSGRHLPIHFTNVACGSQIIKNMKTDIHVSRSLTRLKAIFITLLKASSTVTSGSQEAERFWHPMGDYIVGGVSSYKSDYEIEVSVQIGSKTFPIYPIRSLSESFSHLHKTMGLHFGSGAVNISRYGYRTSKYIVGIDLEKMTGVGFSGMNTQDGQLLSIKLGSANKQITLDADAVYTVYYSLVYDGVVNIKMSGVDAYE